MTDLDRLFILEDGGTMASVHLDLNAQSGELIMEEMPPVSRYEDIGFDISVENAETALSVVLNIMGGKAHFQPTGDHTYYISVTRAIRGMLKGQRLTEQRLYPFSVTIIGEDGSRRESQERLITLCASTGLPEDDMDRAFNYVRRRRSE